MLPTGGRTDVDPGQPFLSVNPGTALGRVSTAQPFPGELQGEAAGGHRLSRRAGPGGAQEGERCPHPEPPLPGWGQGSQGAPEGPAMRRR